MVAMSVAENSGRVAHTIWSRKERSGGYPSAPVSPLPAGRCPCGKPYRSWAVSCNSSSRRRFLLRPNFVWQGRALRLMSHRYLAEGEKLSGITAGGPLVNDCEAGFGMGCIGVYRRRRCNGGPQRPSKNSSSAFCLVDFVSGRK